MTYAMVRTGIDHQAPVPSSATAIEASTCVAAYAALLKRNAHHGIARPGTLPSKVANQATAPTATPGEYKPVATKSGSTTDWCPVFQGIGRSAAICVPTARYSKVGRAATDTGLYKNQPIGTMTMPIAIMVPAYRRADPLSGRKGGKTLEF